MQEKDIKNRVDKVPDKNNMTQNEKFYRELFDLNPLGCVLWDDDYSVRDCNNAAVKLFGFSDKQELFEYYPAISPEYQPDGQLSADKNKACVKKAFAEGEYIFEWMYIMPDGEPLPAEITLVRVDAGDDYFAAGYIRDMREMKSLQEKAERIYYDALTGLYNRRYFEERMEQVMNSLSRSGGMLSVMMVDIDNFKEYNDNYGHGEGDKCLRAVALALYASAIRKTDFIARYGGEEFAVVLPDTGESGARLVAERILNNVRKRKIPHEKSKSSDVVTVSVGVTSGTVNHNQSYEDYIKRADILLYMSKRSGRDKSTFGRFEAGV